MRIIGEYVLYVSNLLLNVIVVVLSVVVIAYCCNRF